MIACRRDLRVGPDQGRREPARKHRVSFEEAASVFLDSAALTFFDPDHSKTRSVQLRSGVLRGAGCCSSRTPSVATAFVSSAQGGRPAGSNDNIRKGSMKRRGDDDLRPEYDLRNLKGGVRGKYYHRAMTGTNLVLLDPDVARAFPDSGSVNRALRLLHEVATKSSRRRRKTAVTRRRAAG